jgi:hypothetical protein
MWCAIQVTADGGKTCWLSNPDRNGHRSIGDFDDAAIFWRTKHAEAAIGLFMRQSRNLSTSQIRIVDVDDRIFSDVAAAGAS